MNKMKTMMIEDFGDSSVLSEKEIQIPEPGDNEILLKVAATSVNPVDNFLRMGGMPQLIPQLPAVLHSDVSGTVVKKGKNVNTFKEGDKVIALYGGMAGLQGALAEYMLVDKDCAALAPETISLADAASIPLVGLTAWESLVEKANIQKGDRVLVFGGTGGVGHFALQLAAAFGCEVTATGSSEEKLEIAKSLGAKHTHNYKTEKPEDLVARVTDGKGFDVVFDTVGGDNVQKSFSLVRPGGKVATILSMTAVDLTQLQMKNISLYGEFVLVPLISGNGRSEQGKNLQKIVSLVNQKKITPLVYTRKFAFDKAGDAHDLAASGNFSGKIVLENRW